MRNLLSIMMLLSVAVIEGREADERKGFLFSGDEVILEYQIDYGRIDEYYESLGEEASPAKEVHRIPSFLTSNYEFDRVVNWYSPWCAHCQKFKPKYVQMANTFQESSNRKLNEIEFHSISCSAHHWLCKASAIQGYPIVRSYHKGSAEYIEIKRFTPNAVASAFGVQLDSRLEEFEDIELHAYKEDVYDVLGAAMDAYRRTKTDIFHDATVSLLFALQFDVNISGGDELIMMERIDVFAHWIDLLFWTLPSSWKVLTLVNDLRTNNNIETMKNSEIAGIVEANKDVVLPDPSILWTGSCQSRERSSEGYTCGLWSLFHIISIGVAEQHHAVIGDTGVVNTERVAITMHDYVNNFLGCKICKKNFNKLYKKSCGKKVSECVRFSKKPKRGIGVDPRKNIHLPYWRDLAIWIWELHNAINIEVLYEKKKSIGKVPTEEEKAKVIYPSKEMCLHCRTLAGDWNETEVYSFLKSQYWPEGVHNFRYVVLKSKKEDLRVKVDNTVKEDNRPQWLFMSFALLMTIVTRRYQSSQNDKLSERIRKKTRKSK
jgi:thiol-disulfide isomerase/thioredoxin